MKKYKPAPEPIMQSLRGVLRPLFFRQGFTDEELLLRWPEIVGSALAPSVMPLRLSKARDDESGTLRLLCANGGVALEVQHLEKQILSRINSYFGYKAVSRLSLTQGPLPRRKSKPQEKKLGVKLDIGVLEKLDDPDLRAAFSELAKTISKK